MAKKLCCFLIEPKHAKALQALKRRDGVGLGETIRRALGVHLVRKGVLKKSKAERKRAATRRRH